MSKEYDAYWSIFFCILKHILVSILHIFWHIVSYSAFSIAYQSTFCIYMQNMIRFVHLAGVSRCFNEFSKSSTRNHGCTRAEQKLGCKPGPQVMVICGPPRWYQRLGPLPQRQGPPFQAHWLQSKLSILSGDPLEPAPGSARPWLPRAWRSKVRLTAPASPRPHELALGWKMAGTRRGCRCRPGSPVQSEGFPWCLYRSFSTWDIFQI